MNNKLIRFTEKNLHKETYDKIRHTARGIIINDKKQVLMLYSRLFDDYTFPGGGIKENESNLESLLREMKEEAGIVVKNANQFLTTEELRYGINGNDTIYLQTSFYYLCEIDRIIKPKRTKREDSQKLSTIYIDIDEAIKHNERIWHDDTHQAKGLQTVLLRDNYILRKLKGELEMRKFEVVKEFEDQGVLIPIRATKGSAGYDLASITDVTINPGQIVMINTGLKAKMPEDEALFVFPRSSLALKKGLTMSNNVGVVDSDYYNNENNEGHIMIPLLNISNTPQEVLKGERVAQGIFIKYQVTSDDDVKEMRSGGFGSSDK